MSYALSSIQQIRFPSYGGPFGTYQLVINRPGINALTVAATDTLLLSRVTNAQYDHSPYILSDIHFSKKFTTTKGRRALDDVTLEIRDSYGYSGKVNSVAVQENFASTFETFFAIWFTGVVPFKAFVLWTDAATGTTEVSHEGWIDPTYHPSKDPNVTNVGTTSQTWIGTRTVKVTKSATSGLWSDVLALISQTDCQEGNAMYAGFMYGPDGSFAKVNSRTDWFSAFTGQWYQATPYAHQYSTALNPILTGMTLNAVWPTQPWTSNAKANQIATFNPVGGTGYILGDKGFVVGGTGYLAQYTVLHVAGGVPSQVLLTDCGEGFTISTGHATVATTGSGTGMTIDVTSLGTGLRFGPSGLVCISLGTLFVKIANVLGLATFNPATDLKSALDFFAQKVSGTSFPIATTAIPLNQLYVSLNVFAKSHPYDGSYWDNPCGFNPDSPLTDVLASLCNGLLVDFNEVYDTAGNASLKLVPMGSSTTTLPTAWTPIGVPNEEDPATIARSVIVNNRGDDLKIQAPLGTIGDTSPVEVPFRLHRIGATSGSAVVGDSDSVTFDGNKTVYDQAEECFKIVWFDSNGAPSLNPNVWKGMCHLYWFNASNTNVVYPSNWSPFDTVRNTWANSFYAVNACYKSGVTPPADLMAAVQGISYFNSRDYHAVAFASLTLADPTIQSFEYAGVSDSTGSVQNIGTGMQGTWRYGSVASQTWRATEITQTLVAGTSVVKWQAQNGGAFPNISDITHGPFGSGGGNTSTGTGGGSNTSNGGVQTIVTGNPWIATSAPSPAIAPTATGTDSIAIGDGAVINGATRGLALGKSYASGNQSIAIQTDDNTGTYGALGTQSIAIGHSTKASNTASLALGENLNSTGNQSIAIGNGMTASGSASVSIGQNNVTGTNSISVHGQSSAVTIAGNGNTNIGYASFAALGTMTGTQNIVAGGNANSLTTGSYSGCFAGNSNTIAGRTCTATLGGVGLVAADDNQALVGSWSNATSGMAFIVGNGTGSGARSNAFSVTKTGAFDFAGSGTVNGTLSLNTHQITGVLDPINPQDAATKNYVDTHGRGRAIYGDGSDGAVVFDGSTTYPFATLAGSTYTLTRPVYGTTVVVNGGVHVLGYFPIFATVSITNNGEINNAGGNATGPTGGTGGKTLGIARTNGGDGKFLTGNGTSVTQTHACTSGGAGAADNQGHTIGNGAVADVVLSRTPDKLLWSETITQNNSSYLVTTGGGAAGGGAFNSGTYSGGGGQGGGWLSLAAPAITNGGTITAAGGNGDAANGTGDAGGGGGGGGGIVVTVSDSAFSGTVPIVTFGSGGAGIGTGNAGQNGQVGQWIAIRN